MKRIFALILATMLILSLCGCGNSAPNNSQNVNTENDFSSQETSTSDKASSDIVSSDESFVESSSENEGTESVTEQSSSTESSLPPHEHSYIAAVTTSPTCTEAGINTFTCSCGSSYTEEISAKGHLWSGWGNTSDNNPKRMCLNCGATEKKNVVNLPIIESKDYFDEE